MVLEDEASTLHFIPNQEHPSRVGNLKFPSLLSVACREYAGICNITSFWRSYMVKGVLLTEISWHSVRLQWNPTDRRPLLPVLSLHSSDLILQRSCDFKEGFVCMNSTKVCCSKRGCKVDDLLMLHIQLYEKICLFFPLSSHVQKMYRNLSAYQKDYI